VIDVVARSLASVTQPRFYETERGFQGEFLAIFRAALPAAGLPGDAIVEQEYQKRLREHGITVRPDIIVHIPTPVGGNRRRGNFAVFELKLAARAAEAQEDFASLDAVLGALDYPLGIFVNIAAPETHAELYGGPFPGRIHCFAVQLIQRRVRVAHAWFNGTRFVEGA
jgi:hypothetical protein